MRVVTLGFALWAGIVPFARSDAPVVPHNVVVILLDDVGVDLIGAYEPFYDGHPNPNHPNRTPTIDRLAQSGMLFRNCWANPICSPTRAQILTGRPACRSGIGWIVKTADWLADGVVGASDESDSFGVGLDPEIETIATVLRAPGAMFPYETAALGKWHLADLEQHPPTTGPIHPLGAGSVPWFHRYAGSIANLGSENYNYWTKTFGATISSATDECLPMPGSYCESKSIEYATADTTDDAIQLASSLPEPFFLYVAYNAIHTPLNPPFQPLTGASCFGGTVTTDPVCGWGGDVPTKGHCMMQWLDSEIGRLVCVLEDSVSQPELPTTIILMGDNGTFDKVVVPPFVAGHGKRSMFQGGINVPLIVKSPLIPSPLVGGTCNALVAASDLFATIAELAFAPLPPDPHRLRDSVSIVPYLGGHGGSIRSFVYSEWFRHNFRPTPRGKPPAGYELSKHYRAIRDVPGMKLIQTVTPGAAGTLEYEEHLFDLSVDPHELVDRIGSVHAPPYDAAYTRLRGPLATTYPPLVTP